MIDVTIIIVSWNTWSDLDTCLRSVEASRFSGSYEVVVVDNASTDGTPSMLRSAYPWVKVIQNQDNRGFPGANNQGLEVAAGEFVLYLNPDTEVGTNTLAACVDFMRQTPKCGLMGCKVLYPDGRVQQECARNFPTLDAMVWESIYFHKLFPAHPRFAQRLIGDWDHNSSRRVPCLIGAFMLGRTDLLRRLGGLDESVFMFFEDVDLCYRVAQSGFEVHYLADVSIVHKSGRSQRKAARPLIAEMLDAHLAFFRKHGTRLTALACWLLLLWEGVFRLIVSLPLAIAAAVRPGIERSLGDAHRPTRQLAILSWAVQVVAGKRPSVRMTRQVEVTTASAAAVDRPAGR